MSAASPVVAALLLAWAVVLGSSPRRAAVSRGLLIAGKVAAFGFLIDPTYLADYWEAWVGPVRGAVGVSSLLLLCLPPGPWRVPWRYAAAAALLAFASAPVAEALRTALAVAHSPAAVAAAPLQLAALLAVPAARAAMVGPALVALHTDRDVGLPWR